MPPLKLMKDCDDVLDGLKDWQPHDLVMLGVVAIGRGCAAAIRMAHTVSYPEYHRMQAAVADLVDNGKNLSGLVVRLLNLTAETTH